MRRRNTRGPGLLLALPGDGLVERIQILVTGLPAQLMSITEL